jgi:hypothetical protein
MINNTSTSNNDLAMNEIYKKKYQKYKIKYIKLLEIYGGKKGSSSNRGNEKTKKSEADDNVVVDNDIVDNDIVDNDIVDNDELKSNIIVKKMVKKITEE